MRSIIIDRQVLHERAQKSRRQGKSIENYENFVRDLWPSKIANIGEENFRRVIACVWGDQNGLLAQPGRAVDS